MKARNSWELVALTMLIILPLIAVFAVILRPVTVDMVSVEKKQPRLVEVGRGLGLLPKILISLVGRLDLVE